MDYNEFIESKVLQDQETGFEVGSLNPMLFGFQQAIVRWAIRRGRSAIFADTGLGKTPMQLEWGNKVFEKTKGKILILSPLAVSRQTVKEGEKFGIAVNIVRKQEECVSGLNITNYEMLHNFIAKELHGVILDESSILKSYSGKIRNQIISMFKDVPYRLACTATPAPNDYMELGNHAEYLGILSRVEMLANFFVHDGGDTQKWRLKGHAKNEFWRWLSTWAVSIKKPSDIGFNDDGFILPELKIHKHIIKTNNQSSDKLFEMEAMGLTETRKARKASIDERVNMAASIANANNHQSLVWCDYNDESAALKSAINEAVEVKGSDSIPHKENSMIGFSEKRVLKFISKPSICGFGMNWQNCNEVIFVGISHSYEQFYQAIRRCWRFGQKKEVNVHLILSDIEMNVLRNLERKEKDAQVMSMNMISHMSDLTKKELEHHETKKEKYVMEKKTGENWTMYKGDCVDVLSSDIDNNSIDYTIFSPPFAELYTYSDSLRDMGNSKNYDEFFEHFKYLVDELYRVTKPGRLVSVHCMDIPSMKERDGIIGIKDFPGDLIRAFQRKEFIYHSRHVIWKDPLIEATRTKALGLMHKQIQKDSTMCRSGLPDYLLTFRKFGINDNPVAHPNGFEQFIGEKEPNQTGVEYSHNVWRRYASPVWMDINQSNTLQKTSAREEKDEKHICPLQLDVIARGIELWSNPGDIVHSPFGGIASEGYQSLLMGRKFIGIELKQSYYDQAVSNLYNAGIIKNQQTLFGD